MSGHILSKRRVAYREDFSGFRWKYTWSENKFGLGYKRWHFQLTSVGTNRRPQDVLLTM